MTADRLADHLLPGVPEAEVRARLEKAGGNEIASGKFANPESSAALAVNGFGWFLERPNRLPSFPPLADLDWPAVQVDVERQMRFPWRGGRHPWLDAAVETERYLVGVESKRFEPYRDSKTAKLSDAYDRDVWGEGMARWCALRDTLRASPTSFRWVDAAQLVKHAFGLVSEGRRIGKAPVLLYLFAEPTSGRAITPQAFADHRAEIARLADHVAGDAVRFAACSWREWLATFSGDPKSHGDAVLARFVP